MYVLLTLISFVLLVIFVPLGILAGTIVNLSHNKGESYYKKVAIAADIFGNIVCQELFNWTLIKRGGFGFGDPSLTVSATLEKNLIANTLTWSGKILCSILVWLKDPAFKK